MLTAAGIIDHDGSLLIARRKERDRLVLKWEVPGSKREANPPPEHRLGREHRKEFGIVTEVTGFVGKTVHAYDHRTLALLASTVVYRSGTFVLHDHAAMHWGAVAALDASDGVVADLVIVR